MKRWICVGLVAIILLAGKVAWQRFFGPSRPAPYAKLKPEDEQVVRHLKTLLAVWKKAHREASKEPSRP